MGCLISARYTMLADFYQQSTETANSGQVRRFWDRENSFQMKNITQGILGGGIRVVGSTESWGRRYEDIEWAKMYTATQILGRDEEDNPIYATRRFRVSNIRDEASGRSLWVSDEGKDIEFNVMGITPIFDPFGTPIEYEFLLKGIMDKGED